MTITLSDSAAQHVLSSLAARGRGVGIRLGVKTTGCSGLAYTLEYADAAAASDQTFTSNGVVVLAAPADMAVLDGIELDFERKGLNKGFTFKNPKERDRCGCGESFRV